MVTVVREVCVEPHLHCGVRVGHLPRVAPQTSCPMDVNVQLRLALEPVPDSLRNRIEDQRERFELRLDDGLG
jgi:hypothetical protein